MIGQNTIKERIKTLVDNNKLPRFVIITGPKGSGKRTLCNEIAHYLGLDSFVECGIKVEDVRDIIEAAYKVTSLSLYVIADADNMSLAAKNAMLKVMEEPPNNAYFVLTLQDLSQTLDTIRSRATIFHMDNYTPNDILEYAPKSLTEEEKGIIINVCETPYEVDTLIKCGITEFYEYVRLVVDNVAEVSGANCFKIGDKIAFKDEEDKYNLLLFWKAFMTICTQELFNDPLRYTYGVKTTSKYLQELFITGINKHSVFDMWLLEIRSLWME